MNQHIFNRELKSRKLKTVEACKILGMKRSNIQYYYDQGIIVPVEDSSGRGSHRYFSTRNLVEITIVKHLVDLGLNVKLLERLFQSIQKSVSTENAAESKIQKREVDFLDPAVPHPTDIMLCACLDYNLVDLTKAKELTRCWVFRCNAKKPESIVENIDVYIEDRASMILVNLSHIRDQVVRALLSSA